MRRPGRPREARNAEDTTTVSTRYPESLIEIIDSNIPDKGKDRSEVLRRAVLLAGMTWSRERLEAMTFDELLAMAPPSEEYIGEPDGPWRQVQLQVTGAIPTEQDAADFATTVEILGRGSFPYLTVTGPGTATIEDITPTYRYLSGPEVAAHKVMLALQCLPDINPWKLPLARQVMNPSSWSVRSLTNAEYFPILYRHQLATDTIAPATSPIEARLRPVEARLRAVAEDLIAKETMYAWGGGNSDGPTYGIRDDGGLADQHGDYATEGFDAGSLTQYVYKKAFGIPDIPRTTYLQHELGTTVGAPHPGDLIFPVDLHNAFVAIYLGRGEALCATQSGDPIQIKPLFDWGKVEFHRIIEN